jgi:hypothetical protein
MTLKPGKLGAEPKKIAILAALLAVAGYFYFSSGNSGEPSAPAARRTANAPQRVPESFTPPGRTSTLSGRRDVNSSPREFRPSFRTKDIDPSKIDPTLHLSLLAKLQSVTVDAGARSLFDIAAAPPAEIQVKEPPKIEVAEKFVGPRMPAEKPKAGDHGGPAADPKDPPIPLKFYGFVSPPKAGVKRAFFLDGENIIIAAEGDVIKKRYKIVRIGVNSAVLEDTEFKGKNQQTLPLVAEING